MSKWICRKCATPCKLDFCTDKAEPELCAFLRAYDAQWEPDVPAAQPEPEPELMTMAVAIAKAVEMGGGEVWFKKNTYKKCTVTRGGIIEWGDSAAEFVRWDKPLYTVRPLAPALLPCPFCGGEAELTEENNIGFIRCKKCPCGTKLDTDTSSLIAAWNRREGSGS